MMLTLRRPFRVFKRDTSGSLEARWQLMSQPYGLICSTHEMLHHKLRSWLPPL